MPIEWRRWVNSRVSGDQMDKPMSAYEVEDRIALLVAQETSRLLRDLDGIEKRLDLVECVIRRESGSCAIN